MTREKRSPCLNADGSRKRVYLSKKEAKLRVLKGQGVYPCDLHGESAWHVSRTRYVPKTPPEQGGSLLGEEGYPP